ncbi:hypothetical protein HID58_007448 [Brassica napus]|uniref:C2 domain-containing protein n=3 Tax=Brassica TaxID=3705 RepID=A0ABQ8EE83_BRANA|nr:hypothetical protein HID58_007448 [Brassica napus]
MMRDVIDEMNGKELDGRTITVNESQSRGSGGGGGRGGGGRGGGGYSGRGGGDGQSTLISLERSMANPSDSYLHMAWHSDAATVSGTDALANIRSKVYLSPKLWYLRVNVIEAQDLIPSDKGRYPEVYVKAIVGNQALRTRVSQSRTINPMWNKDLMFVAAEPFEEPLILSVEDRVAPNKDEVLGRCAIPLQHLDRRFDHRPVNSRWFNLEKHIMVDGEKKEIKFTSRIHMRICLEEGDQVREHTQHLHQFFIKLVKL